MLADLDATLEALLKGSLPDYLKQNLSITFAPPDDHFPPSTIKLPAVDLFLFLIEENRELRNPEPSFERQEDGSVIRRSGPARIDCHYLVTVFTEGAQKPEEDEHRILGEVMRVLLRHRQIPREFLRGEEFSRQQPPVRSTAMMPSSTQRTELWQALKGRPRASLHYVLTLSMDTSPGEGTQLPAVTQGGVGARK